MFSREQYETVRDAAGLLDRRSRGRLRLTGADRRDYLHGLLTNDIAGLSAGQGCYATLLTPQGRMITDMRVSELGQSVLIDLPSAPADAVRQRLSDFIFSEDVDVTDVRSSLGHLAIYGPRAADALAATALDSGGPGSPRSTVDFFSRMRPDANVTCAFEGTELVVVSSDDYGVSGFELFIDSQHADALARALRAAGAQDVSAATVDVTRIEAGRPEFGVDMDEHTIPLEAGIEDRAISLTKGCYVGQEIIIRVLHRGQGRVARRLVGLAGDVQDGPFDAGDRLFDEDGVKEIGVVSSAALSPRLHRPIGLGYVHRDHTAPGTAIQLMASGDRPARRVTVAATAFTRSAAE